MARPVNVTLGRRLAQRWLAHTYSRSAVSEGAADAHNVATLTYGTPTTGVACLYEPSETLSVDETGRRTVSDPTLFVLLADTLKVGDRVTALASRSGTSLSSGTFTVETIDGDAVVGDLICKRATLRAAAVAL